MTSLVIDASFAASILIRSQRTPRAQVTFESLAEHEVIAPYAFSLEMPSLLLKQERRTTESGFAACALARLSRWGVSVSAAPDEAGLTAALRLASRFNTGFFDAMYLLLARQAGAALVTRDGGMIVAAARTNIAVLDVR